MERIAIERSQMATKIQGKLLKPNSHQKAKLPLKQSQLERNYEKKEQKQSSKPK
jgi:hypothetical protein